MTGKPLTDEEQRIGSRIQRDLPLCRRPFAEIAGALGLSEAEVLAGTERLLQRGIIRKFAAIVRHRKVGYTRNALVVWAAPASRIGEAGAFLASVPEISHCYERKPPLAGRYNLFCMMHFRNRAIEPALQKLASEIDMHDYKVFESHEELKKTSMEYFS